MAEGKTSMFGKTYNTIGSTDSNFIIKTKGDLKVQWGNKYIDVIKNGKIASEGSKILFVVNNPEEIQKNGVYIVTSIEGNELWVCIDGIKIQIANTSEQTTYVSFLVEQKATTTQKHQALTNIGFYYESLSEAKFADIQSGIIYVENEQKLYIAKNGLLTEYIINNSNSQQSSIEGTITKHPLYIEDYSLWENGIEYIQCSGEIIHLYKQSIFYSMVQSPEADEEHGYRIYIEDDKSILEIDMINQRIYPWPITHVKLLSMIENKQLNPKMYYIITDFQNPWEVTWNTEPTYYVDTYTEIEKVEHLSGLRNMMRLVIQAKNDHEIEQQVWDPLNPDWIIHYDPYYLGPEHKIIDSEGKEKIYYGFRTRVDDDGITHYLPCKGKIIYLKDEFGNEGNFNFRHFRFKYSNSKWRYCIDNSVESSIIGEFGEGSNNSFFFDPIDMYTQIFTFEKIKNTDDEIIGYKIVYDESINAFMQLGYKIRLQSSNPITQNYFKISWFPPVVDPITLDIKSENFSENKFIEVYNKTTILNNKLIKNIFSNIYYDNEEIKAVHYNMEGNILENISGKVLVEGNILNNTLKNLKQGLWIKINCEGNTINAFLDTLDLVIEGKQFDNNTIQVLQHNINNINGIFNKNIINQCLGEINNTGTIENNNIEIFKNNTYINNSGQFINNIIVNINSDVSNTGLTEGNTINTIDAYFSNNKEMINNQIELINDFTNQMVMEENIIVKIDQVYGGTGIMKNNNILLFKESEITGEMHDNIIDEIITCYIQKKFNNNIIKICNNTFFDGDVSYNKMYKFIDTYVLNTFSYNKVKGYIQNCYFNKETIENIVVDNIIDCDLQDFIKNRIYDSFENISASKEIKNCVFNNSIKKLTCRILNNCYFDEIDSLDLYDDVYYTSFHGHIGNPLQRELTEDDWILLKDKNKKKDAYPNIKVVCIPELYIPGMIIMWHGSTDTIPEGWYLCDGKNGTPNLIGKFIKAGEEEGDNETDSYLQEGNMLTLDKSHLPKHSHPHNVHTHDISVNTYESTTDPEPISVVSNTQYVQDIQENFTDFVTGVEGEGVDNIITSQGIYKVDQNKDFVYSDNSGHSHNFSVSLDTPIISEVESKEIGDWEDPIAIKIEPAAYSLIFIMRGYDN